MDYVCLATSYALEQGVTPKGRWCGNSHTHTHTSWAGLMLLVTHTLPCKWSSLLLSVICMGKKKPCYSQKLYCTHYLLLPDIHVCHIPENNKCSNKYQVSFNLQSIMWKNLTPSISLHLPAFSTLLLFLTQICFFCWAALSSWRNLDSAPFPDKSYWSIA